MLEDLRHSNKTIGIKQTLKAVTSGKAKKVFIAKDAEPRVVRELKDLCEENSIHIITPNSMKELGKACGIDVKAAVAAIIE